MRNLLHWIGTTICLLGFGVSQAQPPDRPVPDRAKPKAAAKKSEAKPKPAARKPGRSPDSVPDEPPPPPKRKP